MPIKREQIFATTAHLKFLSGFQILRILNTIVNLAIFRVTE